MTTKTRKFGGKTLLFLMAFYLLLGGIILPQLQKVTFDENNPPPPYFPVVVGGDNLHPSVWDYTKANESHYNLITKEAEFEEYPINFSLKVQSNGIYELQAKTSLYTQYHYYSIDGSNKAVPISARLDGLIIWIWSLVCLIGMTVLIIVVKLIYLGWKKYQNRYEDDD